MKTSELKKLKIGNIADSKTLDGLCVKYGKLQIGPMTYKTAVLFDGRIWEK